MVPYCSRSKIMPHSVLSQLADRPFPLHSLLFTILIILMTLLPRFFIFSSIFLSSGFPTSFSSTLFFRFFLFFFLFHLLISSFFFFFLLLFLPSFPLRHHGIQPIGSRYIKHYPGGGKSRSRILRCVCHLPGDLCE